MAWDSSGAVCGGKGIRRGPLPPWQMTYKGMTLIGDSILISSSQHNLITLKQTSLKIIGKTHTARTRKTTIINKSQNMQKEVQLKDRPPSPVSVRWR